MARVIGEKEKKARKENEKHLIHMGLREPEERKKITRKGGINSGKARREKKLLKETLLMLLEQGKTQENITIALIQQALEGNVKAYEVIRDTVGEKPTDKVEVSKIDVKDIVEIESLVKDGKK